jgi:Carbohydrate esterase, sialic acid-specific acetylesterase
MKLSQNPHRTTTAYRELLTSFWSFGLVLLVLSYFGPLNALYAIGPSDLPRKSEFHLYLLIGQSNMAGRGEVEELDRINGPRLWTHCTLTNQALE